MKGQRFPLSSQDEVRACPVKRLPREKGQGADPSLPDQQGHIRRQRKCHPSRLAESHLATVLWDCSPSATAESHALNKKQQAGRNSEAADTACFQSTASKYLGKVFQSHYLVIEFIFPSYIRSYCNISVSRLGYKTVLIIKWYTKTWIGTLGNILHCCLNIADKAMGTRQQNVVLSDYRDINSSALPWCC